MKRKFALISVSDKTNLDGLIESLVRQDYNIISTGGTYETIENMNIKGVKQKLFSVEEITHFPECLDGRVKTLNPVIEGGILYDRGNPRHVKDAKKYGLPDIDVVVCNLYPFKVTVDKGEGLDEILENVDIGGPTMISCAVKNYKHVSVLTDPSQYDFFAIQSLKAGVSEVARKHLAVEAINRIADYRSDNAVELSKRLTGESSVRFKGRKGKNLRYGENSHQKAIFFSSGIFKELRCEKNMSYNNYLDANSAFLVIQDFKNLFLDYSAVVMKHQVPCGIATAGALKDALNRAIESDHVSAYGSVVALSHTADLETMKLLCEKRNMQGKRGWFIEVLLAPGYDDDAFEYFCKRKAKKNVRLLQYSDVVVKKDMKALDCGVLVQDKDFKLIEELKLMTNPMKFCLSPNLFKFAYLAVKHVKSNAITIAREYDKNKFQLLGLGGGQPNRLTSCELALKITKYNLKRECPEFIGPTTAGITSEQATENFKKQYYSKEIGRCVAASDAFFPFRDTLDTLADGGIRYIIQPGGAKGDPAVIDAANERGVTMFFTNRRHFRH